MLRIVPSKNKGMAMVWADNQTLNELYDLCGDATDNTDAVNYEGILMGFAHDLRKAYEGERKTGKFSYDNTELPMYGFEVSWFVLTAYAILLNTALDAYSPKQTDRILFNAFDANVNLAIVDTFPDVANDILHRKLSLVGVKENSFSSIFEDLYDEFMSASQKSQPLVLRHLLGVMQAH